MLLKVKVYQFYYLSSSQLRETLKQFSNVWSTLRDDLSVIFAAVHHHCTVIHHITSWIMVGISSSFCKRSNCPFDERLVMLWSRGILNRQSIVPQHVRLIHRIYLFSSQLSLRFHFLFYLLFFPKKCHTHFQNPDVAHAPTLIRTKDVCVLHFFVCPFLIILYKRVHTFRTTHIPKKRIIIFTFEWEIWKIIIFSIVCFVFSKRNGDVTHSRNFYLNQLLSIAFTIQIVFTFFT